MPPTRDRLLQAAARIHRREGLDALSLRAVAAEVGVTPMAIYRHFRDKDDLVAALAGLGFAKWEGVLAKAVRARTPVRRIERALLAYAQFARDEPRLFELMFLTPRKGIAAAPASLASTPSPAFAAVIAAVHDAMERGEIARANPADTMLFAWATAHGLIALHASGRFGGDDRVFRPIFARQVRRLLECLRP